MKKFFSIFSKRTLVWIFSVFCVLLLSLSVVPRIFATIDLMDFSPSNVAFDPATGVLSFDYTGDDLSSHSSMEIEDGSSNILWESQLGSCTSSHCQFTLVPEKSDSNVIKVNIYSQGLTSPTANYPLPLPTTTTPQTPTVSGWIPVGETWTYASADAPTFTFTAYGDLTGRYSPGMRIKLKQSSTTKYFIITGVSYSSGTTTVTVYGGTDYTLTDDEISSTYFSMVKAPVGFPLDPNKWTVISTNSGSFNQNTPGDMTYYNLAGTIDIPIGAWRVRKKIIGYVYNNSTAGSYHFFSTLSTTNNSESDAAFTSVNANASVVFVSSSQETSKSLTLTTKTRYYGNVAAHGTVSEIDVTSYTLEAVSAYL